MNIEEFNQITEDLKRRRIPPEVKQVVTVMMDKQAGKWWSLN